MNKEDLNTKCDELTDYLGCRIVFSKDRKRAWIDKLNQLKN